MPLRLRAASASPHRPRSIVVEQVRRRDAERRAAAAPGPAPGFVPGLPPERAGAEAAAALRAAEALRARLDAARGPSGGEDTAPPLGPGDVEGGWRLLARLDLGPGHGGLPTSAWAIQSAAGGPARLVATGREGPEFWGPCEVGFLLEERRAAAAAVETFIAAAAGAAGLLAAPPREDGGGRCSDGGRRGGTAVCVKRR